MKNNQENELTYEENQKAKREMEIDSAPEIATRNNQKMKELYEGDPNKWVTYIGHVHKGMNWTHKNLKPTFGSLMVHYKLILKEHEHIADAVIANHYVEIVWKNKTDFDYMSLRLNFFESYNPKCMYQLKIFKPLGEMIPQFEGEKETLKSEEAACSNKWNGYYIEASQEAYDKLVRLGHKESNAWTTTEKYIVIEEGNIYFNYEYEPITSNRLYLIDGEFTETKPIKTVDDLLEKCNVLTSVHDKATISITDDDEEYRGVSDSRGMLDGFASLGRFTPNSEVILYSLVKPIEPKWYEDESNFPALLIEDDTNNKFLVFNEVSLNTQYKHKYRLATKEEVMSLYCDGKE